jgi:hypothetical protein
MVVEGHGELKLETFLKKNIEIPINKLEPFVSYRYLLLLFIPGQRLLNRVCDAVHLQSLAAHQHSRCLMYPSGGALKDPPGQHKASHGELQASCANGGKLVTVRL